MLRADITRLTAGERILAEGLSLAVGTGDRLVVRGPSGAGKTRLLRALAGLDPVDGTLTLDDRPPEAWGWPAWRVHVALVPQRIPPLPGTPAALQERMAKLAAAPADAEAPATILADWGVDAEALARPWASLSGGEAQRVLLALVLARRPRVLLLDEPTAALDAEAVAAVEETLRAWPAIWVTHDAAQRDRVATQTLELS